MKSIEFDKTSSIRSNRVPVKTSEYLKSCLFLVQFKKQEKL